MGMIIPVRVSADARTHVVSRRHVSPPHPLYGTTCPACGEPLAHDAGAQVAVALVYVGTPPDDRRGRWFTGGAVAVHDTCAEADDRRSGTDPQRRETCPSCLRDRYEWPKPGCNDPFHGDPEPTPDPGSGN